MIDVIKDILLINAYWFSLPLIGYALMHFFYVFKYSPATLSSTLKVLLRQHTFVVFVISFAIFVSFQSLFSFIFYIINAPVKLSAVIYLCLLLASLIYVAILFIRHLWSREDLNLLKLKNQTLLVKALTLLVLAILIVDFIISLSARSFAGGDAIYHMSRVVDMLSAGINTQTSFFHNLSDGAYHYNVIYILYAIPAKIFHLEPIKIWEYSLSFYRLIQWFAIFTLSMYVTKHWIRLKSSALLVSLVSLVSAIAFYSSYFYIANYPSQVVSVWYILFIICLLSLDTKKIAIFAVAALSLLITTTHPSYALIAFCFVGILLCGRVLMEKTKFIQKKSVVGGYFVALALLSVGPLITKMTPSNLNSDQMHLNEPPLWNMSGLLMKNPFNALPIDLFGWIMLVLGVIMAVVLLYALRGKRLEWLFVIILVMFYSLVMYFPIIFTALYQFLPVWLIERFSSMNVLVYICVPLAFFGVYYLVRYFIGDKKINSKVALTIFTVGILAISTTGAAYTYKKFTLDNQYKKEIYARMEQTTADFKDILNNQKIVVTNSVQGYYLASMFPIDVVAVEIGHSPMTADATNRLSCLNNIMKKFDYVDLKTVNADYVLIPTYTENQAEKDLADSKAYLSAIAKNQEFYVYQFVKDKKYDDIFSYDSHSSCVEYQLNESR